MIHIALVQNISMVDLGYHLPSGIQRHAWQSLGSLLHVHYFYRRLQQRMTLHHSIRTPLSSACLRSILCRGKLWLGQKVALQGIECCCMHMYTRQILGKHPLLRRSSWTCLLTGLTAVRQTYFLCHLLVMVSWCQPEQQMWPCCLGRLQT